MTRKIWPAFRPTNYWKTLTSSSSQGYWKSWPAFRPNKSLDNLVSMLSQELPRNYGCHFIRATTGIKLLTFPPAKNSPRTRWELAKHLPTPAENPPRSRSMNSGRRHRSHCAFFGGTRLSTNAQSKSGAAAFPLGGTLMRIILR